MVKGEKQLFVKGSNGAKRKGEDQWSVLYALPKRCKEDNYMQAFNIVYGSTVVDPTI